MTENASQPARKKNRLGDILKMVLFLGIGIFFIYWFLLKLEPEQKAAVWRSFVSADYAWVAVSVAICLLSHLVRALRWRLLFRPIGYTPNVNNTFGSVIVAYLANLAFPRAGEVVRCATLRTSEEIPIEKSLGTVVTERLIDTLAFALVVLIGMLVMFGQAKDWLYNTLSEKYDNLPNMTVIISVLIGMALLAFVVYKLLWKRLLNIPFFKKIVHSRWTGHLPGFRRDWMVGSSCRFCGLPVRHGGDDILPGRHWGLPGAGTSGLGHLRHQHGSGHGMWLVALGQPAGGSACSGCSLPYLFQHQEIK